MNTTQSSLSTQLKVGTFALFGVALVAVITVVTNGRPYWWRSCQLVNINVEDATGLKNKSPIRSLGIEIGYLTSVALSESHVTLGICITAPVEVLPATRAYIRGEGFLGDKFVELKPVKYKGEGQQTEKVAPAPASTSFRLMPELRHAAVIAWNWLFPNAWAESPEAPKTKTNDRQAREIPVGQGSEDVQHLVNRVDELVRQMSGLTDNLKESINPEQLRATMHQLNRTLENASKTLAPEGGLNQTAQRTLAKLEDSIEQFRDLMTRVNKGEGSVGKLLNDPSYAEEVRTALANLNRLLNRVADVRFHIDLGGAYMSAFQGGRGWINVGIWPNPDRYFLIGVAADPRGRISNQTVTTTAGGLSTVTQVQVSDPTSLLVTAMFGKLFFNNRLDVAAGSLYGDGAISAAYRFGPFGNEESLVLKADGYIRSSVGGLDSRITLAYQPFGGMLKALYIRAGVESFRGYQGLAPAFLMGGGLSFDDDDIKLLFALK